MPLVIVTTTPGLISPEQEKELGIHLTKVIASALHAPNDEGGELSPDEVEVRFENVSPRTINPSPFSIEVYAFDYPSRKENLGYRVSRITRELRGHVAVPDSVIDGKGGFVEIVLGAGVWEKL